MLARAHVKMHVFSSIGWFYNSIHLTLLFRNENLSIVFFDLVVCEPTEAFCAKINILISGYSRGLGF